MNQGWGATPVKPRRKLTRGDIAFWAAIAAVPVIAVGLVNLEQESQRSGERIDYYDAEHTAKYVEENLLTSRNLDEWRRACIDPATGQVLDGPDGPAMCRG